MSSIILSYKTHTASSPPNFLSRIIGQWLEVIPKLLDTFELFWRYLFLKVDDQEFVNESDVVSGVVPMPHSQEDEGSWYRKK